MISRSWETGPATFRETGEQTTVTKVVMSDEARQSGLPVSQAANGPNVVLAALQLANLPQGPDLRDFPVLRVGSQRAPDGTPYARVMNLARITCHPEQ
jgi:hypothetical protein